MPKIAEAQAAERINFYLARELRERVRRVAAIRRTKEADTLRFLIELGLVGWEAHPSEKQVAS